MKTLRYILILVCSLLAIGSGHSQVPTPTEKKAVPLDSLNLSASLITITPGQDSYSLYGHTAVRIRDDRGMMDYVFNYGAFSMEDEGFLWKFMLGETDYTLSVERIVDVVMWYTMEQRLVVEQKLNMSPAEVRCLFEKMRSHAATPGWTYRYTFLEDNCATRPLALLRESLDGMLTWTQKSEPTTYRKLINSHLLPRHAWSSFGQDMLMGADIDTIVTQEAHTGFPMELFNMMSTAEIVGADGSRRPLVTATDTLNTLENPNATDAEHADILDYATSPIAAGILVLLFSIFVSTRQSRGHEKAAQVFDSLAIIVTTLVGLLLWFEFIFSSLPAVGSNVLTLLFHPLALLWFPMRFVRRSWGSRSSFVALLQPVMLVLFAVAWIVFGQDVPTAALIVALSLLIRSAVEIHHRRKSNKTI